MTRATRTAPIALCCGIALLLSGCGGSVAGEVRAGSSTSSGAPSTSATSTSATATSTSATETTGTGTPTGSASSSGGATAAATTGPAGDPCPLLDPATIAEITGVEVPEGASTADDTRQVNTCRWMSTEPVLVVVTGLTAVAGEEAYRLNRALAPAYFDGDPVDTPVAGAERSYLVATGSGGWVVGALADDRYLSVQVAGQGVDRAKAIALAERAISRMG